MSDRGRVHRKVCPAPVCWRCKRPLRAGMRSGMMPAMTSNRKPPPVETSEVVHHKKPSWPVLRMEELEAALIGGEVPFSMKTLEYQWVRVKTCVSRRAASNTRTHLMRGMPEELKSRWQITTATERDGKVGIWAKPRAEVVLADNEDYQKLVRAQDKTVDKTVDKTQGKNNGNGV